MQNDPCYITTEEISCDGQGENADPGHPLIYLKINASGKVACPYCGQVFIRKEKKG